ncbi:ECF-type sigma factor [Granulicella arctica]|uniref:ECF-type sigma factor n=1 Tax=Granulicella arctica TaxID=940613 RepID=UPI0021DF9D62|nr:ECF-type sigma factor [Granulicella arctica]
MNSASEDITRLLAEMRQGNHEAEARLIPLVYAELHRIAAHYMRGERFDHSLQPTALVHEAYLRLNKLQTIDWQSRSHFFAISANVMRRILVDYARAKKADKRGAEFVDVSLEEGLVAAAMPSVDLIELDDALLRLALFDERQSRIVEMRFFAGLNDEEIGLTLSISTRTVKRDWRIAKAWLFQELNGSRRRTT